jgi:hypothetical protein
MLKLSFAYFFLSHYSAVDFFEIDNNDKFFNAYLELKLGLSDTALKTSITVYKIRFSKPNNRIFKPISASITTTLYPNRAIDIQY